MEQKNNNHQTGQEGGIGRTFNRGPQENEQAESGSGRADISSIDQQEGAMQHGETGGGGHLTPKDDAQEGDQ